MVQLDKFICIIINLKNLGSNNSFLGIKACEAYNDHFANLVIDRQSQRPRIYAWSSFRIYFSNLLWFRRWNNTNRASWTPMPVYRSWKHLETERLTQWWYKMGNHIDRRHWSAVHKYNRVSQQSRKDNS